MIRTSLYEKLFIDGFQKPSYIVVTIFLARLPDESTFTSAAIRTLALHPRLRSTIRTRLGIPTAFVPAAHGGWKGVTVHDEPVDLQKLEEQLLSTPLDLKRELPLEVHLLRDPLAIVAKVHHAVVDGASGFTVLHDFARALEGAVLTPRSERPSSRAGVRDWLRRAQLRPRLPDPSVVASFRPTTSLEREPICYAELVLPGAYRRIARSARTRGATFAELVASALMTSMARYNADRVTDPPVSVGLMFARARGRRTASDAAFRADTCIVSVPHAQLERAHDPATLAELRRRANEDRHNDLALAALYTQRKIFGRPSSPLPTEETSLSFTLSDLTAFGRVLGKTRGLTMTGIRVLASPTSFDHAGMLVTRFGDDVRFSVVAHRDALDASSLLELTRAHLEKS